MVAWEIAQILSLEKYLVPSYLVFMQQQPIVVQKKIDFLIGKDLFELPSCFSQTSLEDYWMSHIIAYILGDSDLHALNIGFDRNAYFPIYFDLENSFSTNNEFEIIKINQKKSNIKYRIKFFFRSKLLSSSLFYFDINMDSTISLKNYQAKMKKIYFPILRDYLRKNKFLNQLQKSALLDRIHRFLKIDFFIGMNFHDFLLLLFPTLPPKYDHYTNEIASILNMPSLEVGSIFFWLSLFHRGERSCSQEKVRKINDILAKMYKCYKTSLKGK